MHTNDPRYLEQRAEEELKLAQKAKDERSVSAHYRMACQYLDLLYPDPSDQPDADEPDERRRGRAASSPSRH